MKTKNSQRGRIEHRPATISIPTADGRGVAETLTVDVPMRWDSGLQEWLIDGDTMEYLETVKTRHMGLMVPAELRALRERLGLTQKQMGELLRIGDKSWTRWETGVQRQSQSMNLLLKLLESGVVSPGQIDQVGAAPPDWSRQFDQMERAGSTDKPVALDNYQNAPMPARMETLSA